MTCEICAEPTSELTSDRPDGDSGYYRYVTHDDEHPEDGLGIIEFEFCCLDHLRLFVEEP